MAASGSLDFPDAMPLLVGREREQVVLRQRLTAALTGHGSLVLIGGEAGIGKTALADALCREGKTQGACVLIGRCYDLTETPPYGPWIELLARYSPTDGSPPGSMPALPEAFRQRGTVGAVASQAELFSQVRDFFTTLAAACPVLLLLDDLHWADPASLDLLRFLTRSLTTMPVLVLATYRADELTRRHPLYQLLPLLVRETHAERLDLQRIEETDVRALVIARYALSASDASRLVAYLHHRSEGNPFFLGELLRTLEAKRVLRRTDDGWTLGDLTQIRVPALLRQVIDGRLARLDEETQRLLAVAAVIGQEVPLTLWAAIADADEETFVRVIEQAMEARMLEMLVDGSGMRFVHALIREALYEGVVPIRCRSWHRQVGERLAARANQDPEAVAYHFQQAGDERAVQWLIQTGDRARQVYAWLTALARYEAALALIERGGAYESERGWLLYRASQTLLYRDPPRGKSYLDEAMRHAARSDDHALLALAMFNRGYAGCFAGDYRQGLADMEAGGAAVEALSAADMERIRRLDPMMTDVRPALVFWLATLGRCDEAITMGERAAMGYHGLHIAYATMGRPDDADHAFRHLYDLYTRDPYGEHSNELGGLILERINFVTLPYRATDLMERARLVEEGEQAYQRASGSWVVNSSGWARMPVQFVEGVWDEAEDAALASRMSGRRGATVALRILGLLASHRGRSEVAWQSVHEGLPAGLATAPGEAHFLGTLALQRLAATLATDANDLATAQQWLEAHDRWLAWSSAVMGQSEGHLGWAAYYRAVGDTERAYEHATQALTHATEPRQPLALLAAHRLLGELDTDTGRYADAERHLNTALALADACAAPYERALTLLALAALRIATHERGQAGTLIEKVRAICTRLGARPALARADALTARLTAETTPVSANPAGLSAREVEVLRLVAGGLTNAQVAERLFLSPHTINSHLTAIYNKLGVTSRSAAIRFALDHDLK